MIRILIALLGMMVMSCSPTMKESASSESKSKQWKTIFNGKNLNGWTVKIRGHEMGSNFGNTFRVSDELLSIRYDQYGDDFNERFGAIYFDRKLTEYRLKIVYRFVGETAPGAPEWGYRDSGVQIHGQSAASMKIDQRFPLSMEYNLHGGNGTDERPVGEICANGILVEIDGKINDSYCSPPQVSRTFHGDQWVTIEIDVRDGVIRHFVNGELILTYSNPIYNKDHDLGKLFIKNNNLSVTDGYISLQSNSHPIDFKSIELMEY